MPKFTHSKLKRLFLVLIFSAFLNSNENSFAHPDGYDGAAYHPDPELDIALHCIAFFKILKKYESLENYRTIEGGDEVLEFLIHSFDLYGRKVRSYAYAHWSIINNDFSLTNFRKEIDAYLPTAHAFFEYSVNQNIKDGKKFNEGQIFLEYSAACNEIAENVPSASDLMK